MTRAGTRWGAVALAAVTAIAAGHAWLGMASGGNGGAFGHGQRPMVAPTGRDAAAPGRAGAMSSSCGNRCHPPLQYHGGAVQHHPRVYTIFWGGSYDAGTRNAVNNMVSGLRGSAYNAMLTLFYDSADIVHNDTVLAGTTTDRSAPSGAVGGASILAEINKVVTALGWTNTADTQFLVLPQRGSSISNPFGSSAFCAYHSWASSGSGASYLYSLIPWPGDAPFGTSWNCPSYGGGNLALAAATEASHEYAETVTDPQINAWYTSDSSGWEIADLCTYAGVSMFGVAVQPMWDNLRGACDTQLVAPFNAADVYAMRMDRTGSGRTEIDVLRGSGDYKTFNAVSASALGFTNPAQWQFVSGAASGGLRDLVAVCLRQCSSNSDRTEVTVLDGAGRWSHVKMHAVTALPSADPASWSFVRGHISSSGYPDLVAICMQGCPSGRTEVTVLDGSTGYQSVRMHAATPLAAASPDNVKYVTGADSNGNGLPDITQVRMHGGSGNTEVAVLAGSSSYQSLRYQGVTALGATAPQSWEFASTGAGNGTGLDDIIAVHMTGAYDTTEVHVLDGSRSYRGFRMELPTALPISNALDWWIGSNPWFSTLPDFLLTASPQTIQAQPGKSGTTTIVLDADNAFLGGVTLTASGVPAGSSVSFSPSWIGATPATTGASTMKVTLASLQIASFSVTVTACGNGICRSTTVTVQPQEINQSRPLL